MQQVKQERSETLYIYQILNPNPKSYLEPD